LLLLGAVVLLLRFGHVFFRHFLWLHFLVVALFLRQRGCFRRPLLRGSGLVVAFFGLGLFVVVVLVRAAVARIVGGVGEAQNVLQ
jgi:hypothetical protein